MEAAAQDFSPGDDRPVKIFFEDEGRFGRISEIFSCWAPSGMRPVVKAQIVREYTHVFSAVCPHDGESFSLILPYADTESMKIFMRELSKEYKDYRLIMVMDQAAWHRSGELDAFENIRIIYQPPYSPELNPVEHLWEHLREKYLRNYFWLAMQTLEDVLEKSIKLIEQSKSVIQKLVGFHWALV